MHCLFLRARDKFYLCQGCDSLTHIYDSPEIRKEKRMLIIAWRAEIKVKCMIKVTQRVISLSSINVKCQNDK